MGVRWELPVFAISAILLISSFGVNSAFASPIGDDVDITIFQDGIDPTLPGFTEVANFPGVSVIDGSEGIFTWFGLFGETFDYLINIQENTIDITDQGNFGPFFITKIVISDMQWIDQITGSPQEGSIVSVTCLDNITGGPITATWTLDSISIFITNSINLVDVSCSFLTEHEEPTIDVDIDIKPGSDPSCFNSDGKGSIPVVIFSTDEFDATQIDPTTLDLDGQSVMMRGPNLLANFEDVDEDGLLDLVVQFNDDDVYPQGTQTGTLTGEFDGTPIEGTDEICITQ